MWARLSILTCAFLVTVVRGMIEMTDTPGFSSTFRDVQSVSESEYQSSTPAIAILKELASVYDDETEYTHKKLELTSRVPTTTVPISRDDLTTDKPTTANDPIPSTNDPVTTSTMAPDSKTSTRLPVTITTPRVTSRAPTSTTPDPSVLSTRTTLPRITNPRIRPTPKQTTFPTMPTTRRTTTTMPTTRRTTTPFPTTLADEQPSKLEPKKVPAASGTQQQICPRPEDIHPCECIEISSHQNPEQIETVAVCKNIRNIEVLRDAMKGMQGHYIKYFVIDSCKMPPFPNGLFHNVGIGWMEMLNSTVQFHEKFFSCTNTCW